MDRSIKAAFEQHFRMPAEQVQPLPGPTRGLGAVPSSAGRGKLSAIGFCIRYFEENVAFLESQSISIGADLPVPVIYAEDLSQGAYLEEDLGDTTLFEFLGANRDGESIALARSKRIAKWWPGCRVFRSRPPRLNYKVAIRAPAFDRQSIAWDLNYFKYYFSAARRRAFNERRSNMIFPLDESSC